MAALSRITGQSGISSGSSRFGDLRRVHTCCDHGLDVGNALSFSYLCLCTSRVDHGFAQYQRVMTADCRKIAVIKHNVNGSACRSLNVVVQLDSIPYPQFTDTAFRVSYRYLADQASYYTDCHDVTSSDPFFRPFFLPPEEPFIFRKPRKNCPDSHLCFQ